MITTTDSYKSVAELAERVNSWCVENGVAPMSGQASEALSARNIRYYRTLGLFDGPMSYRTYGRKHFLQLAAIRTLQARGLPLRRIQALLHGRDEAALEELMDRDSVEPRAPEFPPFVSENWSVSALGGPYALLSRGSARPTNRQLAEIQSILGLAREETATEPEATETTDPVRWL